MPAPSTPEARNLHREAQAPIEQAVVQQAESSASRIRQQGSAWDDNGTQGQEAPVEGPIRRPERGGEWEPIQILLLRENSAYTPNSQLRVPTRVCQGHVVTTVLPTLGTNPK
jgi:hypothetical protein